VSSAQRVTRARRCIAARRASTLPLKQFRNSIPWLKHPDLEEDDKKLARAMSASLVPATRAPKQVSRIKTVGNVKERKTPTPTRSNTSDLDPIVVPRHSRVVSQVAIISGLPMPPVTSPAPYFESTTGFRRDSEVFGAVDSSYSFQSKEKATRV